LAVWMLGQCGCAVPQRPGRGYCSRLVEPVTDTGYWLYLPEDYVRNKGQHPAGARWPLIVTFHGLRPYDDAHPQIREWQEEADRYNFVVIAPELRTCDSLVMQLPLRDPRVVLRQAGRGGGARHHG
jgi:poly(3-hydroxybutyrate) depolymerase